MAIVLLKFPVGDLGPFYDFSGPEFRAGFSAHLPELRLQVHGVQADPRDRIVAKRRSENVLC